MRRRLWALVLGATLALGTLTGCGNTGTTTTTDPAASPMEEMSPEASAAPSA